MQKLTYLFILLFVFGCGKSTAEKADEAIDVALTYLTDGKCDKAIDVLEEAGMQTNNAVYLQVLTSAYACKADFNEIKFIADDLGPMSVSTPQAIVKSFASMSLSNETTADAEGYSFIRKGLNVLLNATSGSPSHKKRTEKFGPRKAGDLGVQTLILSIVNLGKFLHIYGNTDSDGAKGAGAGTNSCLINYSDPRAQALIGGITGACTASNDGHPDMDLSTDEGKRRLCEGVVLLTNSLDVLNNIDLSDSSTLSKLEDVADKVDTFRTAAVAAGLGTIINMTSQSACETYANTPANLLDLEYFYALVFESALL